jgi:hypothetical protein
MRRILSVVLVLSVPFVLGSAARDEAPVFHSDRDHFWNRLHGLMYVRHAQAGIDEQESLEPFAEQDSKFFAKGASPRPAITLLEEFLGSKAERHLQEPLKRAILQHDLWGTLTPTTDNGGDARRDRLPERRALQKRLVQAMRLVALSEAEIKALPDNLNDAV